MMGIIAGLAVPNFSHGYSRFQMDQTAEDLLNISRWTQAMAIGQQHVFALSFSGDRRSYRVERALDEFAQEDAGGFGPVRGNLGRSHAVPDAVHLSSMQDRVVFYPDGTIDPVTIGVESGSLKAGLSSTQVRGMMTKVGGDENT